MRQQTRPLKEPAEKIVQDIRRATRKHYSAEEKIRIVLEGLRGEDSIAELCRREGIAQNLYYRWSKDFLEAGKKRLAGDDGHYPRMTLRRALTMAEGRRQKTSRRPAMRPYRMSVRCSACRSQAALAASIVGAPV